MLHDLVETSPFANGPLALAFGGVFSAILVAVCVTDIRSRRIPNRLVGSLTLLGLLFSMMAKGVLPGLLASLGGLGTGFTVWILFFAVGVMGAGDVKLAAAVGAWLGPLGSMKASLIAAVVGGVLALVVLMIERRVGAVLERIMVVLSTKSLVPLGAHGTVSEGRAVTRRPMPYGVALSIGALIASWTPALFW